MKIVIGIKQIIIIAILIIGLSSWLLLTNQKPLVGRGYNTVIGTGSSLQGIPAIGACTGALGQSKQYLLNLQSQQFQGQVPEILQQLDSLTISCNGPQDILQLPDNFTNMGGQCCGALTNLTKYYEQLEGLKQYSSITFIPPNPYNISVSLAKEMISYDLNTVLSSKQQSILDQGAKLSEEGGPCCCKCWHWYFNEGVAKRLIKEYKFTPQQIANFYDLSDTCGA